MVLKLPSVGHIVEVLMSSENFEFIELFHTYFVVGAFEISIFNVFGSPGPFFSLSMLLFVFGQKILDLQFEFPERNSTIDVVFIGASINHLEGTESIEYSMIPA